LFYPLAIACHDHVINVSAQLARNSGLRARVNRKVATTTADNNKEGDVQVMEFGIISHHCSIQDMMIWYAMCLSSVIGSAAARSMTSMISCNSVTTLVHGLESSFIDTDVITLSRTSLSHLQSYLLPARFTLNFYNSCG